MEQGLRGDVEREGELGRAKGLMAKLDAAEGGNAFFKMGAAHQLAVSAHGLHDGFLFHLGGTLKALGKGLLGEAFVVNAGNGIAHIRQVFNGDKGVRR